MRTATFVTTAVATLAVAGAAVGAMMWPRGDNPQDPANWPVEQLVANPAVALPYVLRAHLDGGCPGLAVSSPTPSGWHDAPGQVTSAVQLASGHYAFVACIGTAEEVGARRSVAENLGAQDIPYTDSHLWNRNATVVEAPVGDMYRVDRAFDAVAQPRLTDWIFDHDGYTYGIGYMHPLDDARYYDEVEAMAASITFDEPGVPAA